MSGGSSRGKGKGKGVTKGNPFLWEGPLGPEDFEEAIYDRFPLESKHDFTKEAPLRGYDDRKEEWPKCMHGEDCLVQMYMDGIDGGRRFFKCPRAWVNHITSTTFNSLLSCTQLIRHIYCSHHCQKKIVASPGGWILDLFIRMQSTSIICRTASLI